MNTTLNLLLKDYEHKKYIADLNFEKEKTEFYNSNPELSKLNRELGKLALDISKAILNKDMGLANTLKSDFNKLKLKKEDLLKSIDVPKRCSKSII